LGVEGWGDRLKVGKGKWWLGGQERERRRALLLLRRESAAREMTVRRRGDFEAWSFLPPCIDCEFREIFMISFPMAI
jgi:hypothetical protein